MVEQKLVKELNYEDPEGRKVLIKLNRSNLEVWSPNQETDASIYVTKHLQGYFFKAFNHLYKNFKPQQVTSFGTIIGNFTVQNMIIMGN